MFNCQYVVLQCVLVAFLWISSCAVTLIMGKNLVLPKREAAKPVTLLQFSANFVHYKNKLFNYVSLPHTVCLKKFTPLIWNISFLPCVSKSVKTVTSNILCVKMILELQFYVCWCNLVKVVQNLMQQNIFHIFCFSSVMPISCLCPNLSLIFGFQLLLGLKNVFQLKIRYRWTGIL